MYIVLEFQTDIEYNTICVPPVAYSSLNEAKNKYYTVLAAAAVSEVPFHTAMLCYHNGNVIASETIEHFRR